MLSLQSSPFRPGPRRNPVRALALVLSIALSVSLAAAQTLSEDEVHPVTVAFEKCQAAPLETQTAIAAAITEKIEAHTESGLKQLLLLRDAARKGLKTAPHKQVTWYDPNVYAPGQQVVRTLVDPNSDSAKFKLAAYRPWESENPFNSRLVYDFGSNLGLEVAAQLPPIEQIWNYLYGYPPGADELYVWLQQQFDHDAKYDAYAAHFAHPYCDLDGSCYKDITLYDAFASKEKIDMPDVDVIPYARNILKESSFRSPIPPGSARDRLYAAIKGGFLAYFQHRTFVEAAAALYLDPEAPLRPEHESLRVRLLYLFSVKQGDPKLALEMIKSAKDRKGFIQKADQLQLADGQMERNRVKYLQERNKTRWAVAECAYEVLREHGFLASRQGRPSPRPMYGRRAAFLSAPGLR